MRQGVAVGGRVVSPEAPPQSEVEVAVAAAVVVIQQEVVALLVLY
jgi:hypothetical protein